MSIHDLCCIGHITHDKVVTPKNTVHMPGGTSFYVSHAIRYLENIDYALITAIAESDMDAANELKMKGINVTVLPSTHSVYFENIYGENQDNRRQRVLSKADPFTVEQLCDVEAKIFHLGALLADDFSTDVVRYLSGKGLVSVDSQGYLREVRDTKVYAVDWKEKEQALQYVHFLKANEHEMKVLTGYSDVASAAKRLYDWGVKEVLITLGSLGSMLYDGTTFYRIPAYKPREIVDATGCGDTYMAGYLYRRAKGADMNEAGHFAAALSTLKIERSGPVQASCKDVMHCRETAELFMPDVE
ncbi:MAG: PfkB family carbohydrate kinase [Tannerella sp.]|nr:PfkB family carbohydrate kinase [Tannerella sp.]